LSTENRMIPQVVHFVWINATRDFGEGEYAAIQSAVNNTGYLVNLHTNLLPETISGPYNPYNITTPKFSICYNTFSDYDGFKMPVGALSDIYRVKILHQYGGIYSDCDILWFKDIAVDLGACNFLGSYENDHPRYQTVVNGLMGSAAGFPPLLELIKEMDAIIDKYKSKGITDITTLPKAHWTFFKVSIVFVKKHADVLLPQKEFFRNGFRRIGRNLLLAGIPLQEKAAKLVPVPVVSKTPLQLDDITGFHWYNYLYNYSDVIQLPGLRQKSGY
jgi:hypothetical protein